MKVTQTAQGKALNSLTSPQTEQVFRGNIETLAYDGPSPEGDGPSPEADGPSPAPLFGKFC